MDTRVLVTKDSCMRKIRTEIKVPSKPQNPKRSLTLKRPKTKIK